MKKSSNSFHLSDLDKFSVRKDISEALKIYNLFRLDDLLSRKNSVQPKKL